MSNKNRTGTYIMFVSYPAFGYDLGVSPDRLVFNHVLS